MELDFTDELVEKLLLNKALSDKGWLGIVSSVVEPDWIRTKYVGRILDLSKRYFEKYDSVPSYPVVQAMVQKQNERRPSEDFSLGEVCSLLAEVRTAADGIDDEVVSSNLKEYIRRKALSRSLLESLDVLEDPVAEKDSAKYQEVIDRCLEKFDRVSKITFNDKDLGMNYFDPAAMEAHWEFIRNPDAKIRTGWDSVDHYTNGGFLKDGRMLALFMAQAGLGKSVFLSNLAVNMLRQNLGVVVISLEMSQDVYAQRFDAHISKKNINRLRENEKTARERLAEFYAGYPQSSLFIKEYPPRSISSRTIEQYLDNLVSAGHKFDAVVVDYLNLVLPNRQTDSMFKDGMSVTEELRALSYKYKVPVISAVQCNSEGMNSKDIDMQNVSESRGIVHGCDALFALYQTQEQRESGVLGFKVIKNRLGGMVGKHAQFKMDPETLIVADVTGDGDASTPPPDSQLSRIAGSLPDIQNDISGY